MLKSSFHNVSRKSINRSKCMALFHSQRRGPNMINLTLPPRYDYIHTLYGPNDDSSYVCTYIHWPKMKTLHFISLNNYFVSIHVVVRFTRAYRDIVADNDYAIFIQIPGLFRCQRLKNVFLTLHVLRNRWFINSFKTDKKTFAAEYW